MNSALTLAEIASLVHGTLVGRAERQVRGVASPEDPHPENLAVVWDRRLLERLPPDIAVLTTPGAGAGRDAVEVADPRAALADLVPAFIPPRRFEPGVHPTAVVDPAAVVDPSAAVGPLCVIESGASVGPRVVLVAQVFVGRNCRVGADTRIAPQVVLNDDTIVGERVVIHSGSVVGADGFGFTRQPDGAWRKVPQIGRAVIEDDVELGALVTVDRATLGETRVGRGTKSDDHVHIGHNCRLGQNCLLVAFAGLAGTATLDDGVVMAARSGLAPHVHVGRGATLAGAAGATTDIEPGAVVSGYPAQDHRAELKQQALVRKLPDLWARVKKLEDERR